MIRKRGAPDLNPPALCTVDGCANKHLAKGMCSKHYNRHYRYGDVSTLMQAPKGAHLAWLTAHVDYAGDECLPWPFSAKSQQGYGASTFNGKQMNASRIMCILAHGEPADQKMDAAHSCGKGHEGCVNPRHLRWATTAENMADKKKHGTQPAGATAPGAKFSSTQIAEIRASKKSRREIAKQYGISAGYVWEIQTGKKRKYDGGAVI